MDTVKNTLFIMVDQLRWDYVSAYGASPVPTPNIDALAARGTLLRNAYVQGPVCGPSRMSYYTGRYVASHGARWNRVPLSLTEKTLGEYLRGVGVAATLAGKSHVLPDEEAIARLGLGAASPDAARLREGGFTPIERFDGHSRPDVRSGYTRFLNDAGYEGDNPWSDYVISVMAPDGQVHSGWNMRHAHLPARVAQQHSESAYLTDVAIDFIERSAAQRWCLHLSYVKPHWPYVAPAPYNDMFRDAPQKPIIKAAQERADPHPVFGAFQQHEESVNFSKDEVAAHVKPTYMGLVAQIDAQIGRVMEALEASGQAQDTLIVFCADHGDMLGDHWLGEKEMFFEAAVRVPLIVVDPRARADGTRGMVLNEFAEAVDVLPTILDAMGVQQSSFAHLVEGRSLLPLLAGRHDGPRWRDAVFSEADYAFRAARWTLGRQPGECRGTMVRNARWKYIVWEGYRPQLFDMENDPDELNDLGAQPPEHVERQMRTLLLQWSLRRKNRTTTSDPEVEERTEAVKGHGIYIGVW